MKFIHLSDLHIHENDEDNLAVFEMFKYITKNYPDHLVIITGDITDDGTKKQYQKTSDLFQLLLNPPIICPGNHDFGSVGAFYTPEKARLFDELCDVTGQQGHFAGNNRPVVASFQENCGKVMVIALDSNIETTDPFDFACGEIGDCQLETLSAIVQEPAFKILIFHHHPFMHGNPFMEMKDSAKLAKVIYGKVDFVLFGHKHEMGGWQGRWQTRGILASDNSPGKDWAREITVDREKYGEVREIKIRP